MKSCYLFEEGLYRIEEKELSLFLEEKKSPLFLPSPFFHRQKVGEDHEVAVELLSDGTKRVYLTRQGKWEGEALHLDALDSSLSQSFYRQGRLHGPSRYYKEKEVLSEAWYWEGKKNGFSSFFYPDKSLYARIGYKEGMLHGESRYYYPNGDVKTILYYEKGKLKQEAKIFRQKTFG